MKGIFKRRGKKLTAVATAFALLCTAGVIPENVLQVSAAETENGGMEEQIPEEGLAIDESNFPDANFRKVLATFDNNDDGVFSKEELSCLTSLNVPGNSGVIPEDEKIESLEGIEKLIYLKNVDVRYHKLSGALDLSDWPKLEFFCCSGNNISSLNLSEQTELETLACESTSIQTLDLSNMPKLNRLICGYTPLKTVDLSKQTQSVELECLGSCLTSLLFPKEQDQNNIHYERSISYLQQKEIDFKDQKIFPNFDTGRLTGIYVTGAGEEEDKSKNRLDTVKGNDYVLTDIQVGDTVCYTYNCAAEDAESAILLDFAITIGYPDGATPPGCPDTDVLKSVPFTTQYLREVPLPEGWKWSDEYDGNEELNDGNSSFYWAEYTGSDKEYYGEHQRAYVGLYRERCDHSQGMMTLYKVTDSTITENTTYAKCEAEECGDYFLAPKENSEYSSMEETDIPVVPVVDCTESTEIHVSYGTELKDLDLVHLKKAGYLSDQESPVNVSKLLVQNVWYREDKDSEQADYYGSVDFTTSLDGVVELTGEEKSLGSISCDRILEPGEYTLDLVMKVGEQNIHVLRTIFVDKIDLSKYSDYNLKITVNEKELSDEPISCNYTKEAVKPTVGIVDVKNNYSLIWNYDFIYDYINNVEVAEADQDNAPTIIVRGISDHYTGELRIPFTIKKSKQPDMPNSILYTSYASKVVGEVGLSGGWKWVSGDSEKALLDVGEGLTVTAEYTGDDWELYETIVQEVTIIRKTCGHPWDMCEYRDAVEGSTCENGYTGDLFCTQCGELVEEGEIIPAPHDLECIDEKAATETTPGNMEYYVCRSCGKYFKDADAEWETTLEEVTIPARGTPAPSVTPVPTQTVEETEAPSHSPVPTQTVEETAVPSLAPAPTPEPTGNPDPTKEPAKTSIPASAVPTQAPTKAPATAVPTKEPTKTAVPATAAPTKEPVQTGVPVTTAPTEAPTRQPVTTEPAPATPELPIPGQSMAPQSSQTPAPSAADTPAPTQTPQWTPMATSKLSQKKPARKGKLITDSKGNRYKVTSSNAKNPTVTFYSAKMTAKKVTMSRSVRIDGVRYCITAVRSRAFEGHKKVTCIWVGSKVNTIGDRAFRKCKKLEKLYIQSSKLKPEDIGERVFENVPKDLKIYVPEKKKDEYRKMFREKGLGKLISVYSL